jgi:hypothetical protein
MSFTSADLLSTGRYFKVASGYVPNQFTVNILKQGATDQISAAGGNPLYLLNLEPWIIEDITLPQLRLNTGNDIYMDPDTLIKPDYILNVETMGRLELTVREKSDLAIHRSLIRCQKEFFNSSYEGTGSLGTEYSIEVRLKAQRFDDNAANGDNIFGDNLFVYGRAILREVSNPKHAFAEKNFLRYTVTFDVNCMAETFQLDPKTRMKSLFGTSQNRKITSQVGSRKIVTSPNNIANAPPLNKEFTPVSKNIASDSINQQNAIKQQQAQATRANDPLNVGLPISRSVSSTLIVP